MNLQEIKGMSAFMLAADIEAASPDSLTSPGAEFLTAVRDSVVETIEWVTRDGKPLDEIDWASELDSSIPVYTHTVWQTFVDLAAYSTDRAEEVTGMSTENAQVVLLDVAEQLALELVNQFQYEDESDEE